MGGNNARQMSGSARAGDDDPNPASGSVAGKLRGTLRRAVSRSHVNLVRDAKFFQRFGAFLHDLEIGITSHHNRYQWLAHQSPL